MVEPRTQRSSRACSWEKVAAAGDREQVQPWEGLCTMTMARPVEISEPPVLRLGQPYPKRGMENRVVR